MTEKFSWTRVLIRVLVAELKLKPRMDTASGEAMGRVLAFLEECGGFEIS
jgi:hypothetical protein